MLSSKGFDLWADGYDLSVGLSDEADSYPFAGYRRVLGTIYASVMERHGEAFYFVFDELLPHLGCEADFAVRSDCAGVIEIRA